MEQLTATEMMPTAEKARAISLNFRMSQKQNIINDIMARVYKRANEGKYDCYCAFYATVYPEVQEAILNELEALGYTISFHTIGSDKTGLGIKIKWNKI